MSDLNPIEVSNNVSLTLSFDELYHMNRLYETILDLDLELNPVCDDIFVKLHYQLTSSLEAK